MTMHLMPVYVTTNNTRSRSSKKPANTAKHDEWLAKRGLLPSQIKKAKTTDTRWKQKYVEDLRHDCSSYEPARLSSVGGIAAKRDIMTNLHKEPEHVQEEILRKASLVMPLYNKGGLQYAGPNVDLTTVGTKSRRG